MARNLNIPKSLQRMAESVRGKAIVLKFYSNGQYASGYCIIDKDSNELITFEPSFGRRDCTWIIHNKCKDYLLYRRSVSGIDEDSIWAGPTGYKYEEKKNRFVDENNTQTTL